MVDPTKDGVPETRTIKGARMYRRGKRIKSRLTAVTV